MNIDQNYYTDYYKGIRDCHENKPAKKDSSDRYYQGWGDQFSLEEVISGEAQN